MRFLDCGLLRRHLTRYTNTRKLAQHFDKVIAATGGLAMLKRYFSRADPQHRQRLIR